MKLPVVYVEWVDAYGRSGWQSHPKKGERIAEHLLPGIGFLVGEDKDNIMLSIVGDAEEHVPEFVIPKACIRKYVPLGDLNVPDAEE